MVMHGRTIAEECVLPSVIHPRGERFPPLAMPLDEQQRKNETRWLANLSREVAHAVIVQDLEGRILSWNEGASMLYGYWEDETFEMPITNLVPSEVEEEYRAMTTQLIKYGYTEPHESTRRTAEGEIVHVFVEMTLLRDQDGCAEAVASVERDITTQRAQEAKINEMGARAKEMRAAAELMLQELEDKEIELARKECLINGILGTAADGIITMGPDGLLESCNDAANRMFGYDAEETERMTIGELMPDTDFAGSSLGALSRVVSNYNGLSKRMREAVESTGVRKNGEGFPLTFSVSELHVGDKHLFTVMLRDETQRKIVENQLNEALVSAQAAVVAKSQFLATMSHEIRTPMNAVIAIGELLEESDLDEEQLDHVQTIRSSSSSLLSIINDILDFSKIESGNLELEQVPMSLRETVENVGQMLASVAYGKGLELVLETDPCQDIEIESDPTRLRQILINLTGNAVKFTSAGEVRIRAHIADRQGDSGNVVLEVLDTGIGIPKEAQSKIFESFSQADSSTTREFGGTGLGLTISRQLALLLGGEMGVESKVGAGSRFWVKFPATVRDVPSEGMEGRLIGKNVLLIEENDVQRKRTRMRFESMGATVHAVADGAEAVKFRAMNMDIEWALGVVECRAANEEHAGFVGGLLMDEAWGKTPLLILTAPSSEVLELDFAGISHMAGLMKPLRTTPVANALNAVLPAGDELDGPAAALPSEVEPPAEASAPGNAHEPEFNDKGVEQFGFHVLLVEDNLINRKVAGKLLARMNCTWDEAVNGEVGVEMAFSGTHYDLILMDLMMPVMGGLDATRAIRVEEQEESSGTPRTIIAMTANAMEDDRRLCLEAGMDDYISKPVKPKLLEEMFRTWGFKYSSELQD